jgi:hypothetical protein
MLNSYGSVFSLPQICSIFYQYCMYKLRLSAHQRIFRVFISFYRYCMVQCMYISYFIGNRNRSVGRFQIFLDRISNMTFGIGNWKDIDKDKFGLRQLRIWGLDEGRKVVFGPYGVLPNVLKFCSLTATCLYYWKMVRLRLRIQTHAHGMDRNGNKKSISTLSFVIIM